MDNVRFILLYLAVRVILCHTSDRVIQNTTKVDVQDWPCLFRPPCYCNYNWKGVYCNAKQFTEVPTILNYLNGNWEIDLSNNLITHIPERVFGNVTLSTIDLSYNNIVFIADNAFFGSEASLLIMHLEHNQLNVLPSTVGNFTKMFELHIEGNPIKELNNDAIFKNISDSLDTLTFGSVALQKWPSGLRYLTGVYELTVSDLQLRTLPEDAFDGIGESLSTLQIFSSMLESIPVSLNEVSKLYHLELRHNKHLTSNGISPVSFKGLNRLREIIIDDSPIESIPPIFNDLSGLGLFSLNKVPISYINESVFPQNFSSQFYKFEFNNTKLDRFPSPKLWSKVPKLFELAITYNQKISNISDNDLREIPDVSFLYLSGNPLESISDDAFRSCKEVTFLYLDNTPLTTIPRAIERMKKVSELDFTNTKIVCSCDNIGWMKHWTRLNQYFSFNGVCINSGVPLKEYILNEIPKCPNI